MLGSPSCKSLSRAFCGIAVRRVALVLQDDFSNPIGAEHQAVLGVHIDPVRRDFDFDIVGGS